MLSKPEVILTHSPSPAWRCSRYNYYSLLSLSKPNQNLTNKLFNSIFLYFSTVIYFQLYLLLSSWVFPNAKWKWCIMGDCIFLSLSAPWFALISHLFIMGMASLLLLYLCITFDLFKNLSNRIIPEWIVSSFYQTFQSSKECRKVSKSYYAV